MKLNAEVTRRNQVFRRFVNLRRYKNLQPLELKVLLKRQRNILVALDFICFISNLIVVTWLYFNHFDYVNNSYIMSDDLNTTRLICLGLSFLSCTSIVARAYNKIIYRNVEFILNLRPKSKYIFNQ
jgi:hypothetical protein